VGGGGLHLPGDAAVGASSPLSGSARFHPSVRAKRAVQAAALWESPAEISVYVSNRPALLEDAFP